MVVALSEIDTAQGAVWPAKECGLEVGDIITEIDHTTVNSIEEVERRVRGANGGVLEIQALRDGKKMDVTAEAAPVWPMAPISWGHGCGTLWLALVQSLI